MNINARLTLKFLGPRIRTVLNWKFQLAMFEPRTPVPNIAITRIQSDPIVATGLVSSYDRGQKVASINKLKCTERTGVTVTV